MNKLLKYSEKFIINNKIPIDSKDKIEIVQHIALHIEYVIFNITSMLCLVAILNNTNKITTKTLDVGKNYIETTCKIPGKLMTGGYLGSATFLGINEPAYNESNPSSDVMTLNFADGLARQQVGGSGSKSKSDMLQSLSLSLINVILKHHGLSAAKSVKNEIYHIAKFHIHCALNCLKKHTKTMKVTKVTHLMKILKKHKMLKEYKK